MEMSDSLGTLGLVSIVAVVGVVGLLTQLQGGNATTVVPVASQAQPTAEQALQTAKVPEKVKQDCEGDEACIEKEMSNMLGSAERIEPAPVVDDNCALVVYPPSGGPGSGVGVSCITEPK